MERQTRTCDVTCSATPHKTLRMMTSSQKSQPMYCVVYIKVRLEVKRPRCAGLAAMVTHTVYSYATTDCRLQYSMYFMYSIACWSIFAIREPTCVCKSQLRSKGTGPGHSYGFQRPQQYAAQQYTAQQYAAQLQSIHRKLARWLLKVGFGPN